MICSVSLALWCYIPVSDYLLSLLISKVIRPENPSKCMYQPGPVRTICNLENKRRTTVTKRKMESR
jgi:hypothetical protein